jgi:hypothetical protein
MKGRILAIRMVERRITIIVDYVNKLMANEVFFLDDHLTKDEMKQVKELLADFLYIIKARFLEKKKLELI